MRLGGGAIPGKVDRRRPLEGRRRLQRILGNIDENWTGAPGRGQVEGLGDRPRNLGRVGDEVVVLGDRHRDAANVGFLECVGSDRTAGYLAGDGHHRHRVHVGVGNGRDEVGRAGA